MGERELHLLPLPLHPILFMPDLLWQTKLSESDIWGLIRERIKLPQSDVIFYKTSD
jgi:hypothetical protein